MSQFSRFLAAQNPVWDDVCFQLNQGRKTSHWMWFVFPQIDGLGRTDTAKFYALESLEQAQDYLDHSVLGARLVFSTELLLQHFSPIEDILGYPDNLKFGSSMTLFSRCKNHSDVFDKALGQFFNGQPDKLTLELLNR